MRCIPRYRLTGNARAARFLVRCTFGPFTKRSKLPQSAVYHRRNDSSTETLPSGNVMVESDTDSFCTVTGGTSLSEQSCPRRGRPPLPMPDVPENLDRLLLTSPPKLTNVRRYLRFCVRERTPALAWLGPRADKHSARPARERRRSLSSGTCPRRHSEQPGDWMRHGIRTSKGPARFRLSISLSD